MSPVFIAREKFRAPLTVSNEQTCHSLTSPLPNDKACRAFPQNRSIYHNSRCTHPVKRPQSRSDAKNAKRQGKHRPKQKNAPESLSGGCITIHESNRRSVLTVQKGERVKMARFLGYWRYGWVVFFVELRQIQDATNVVKQSHHYFLPILPDGLFLSV